RGHEAGESDEATERRSDKGLKAHGVRAMGPASSPFPPYGLHGPAVRLGMRLVKGLRRSDADAISAAVRTHGPFDTVESLFRRSRVPVAALRCLAHADAF